MLYCCKKGFDWLDCLAFIYLFLFYFIFFQRDSNKRKEKSKYSPRLLSFFLTEIAFRNCLRLTVYFSQSPHWRKGITWIIKKKTHHLLCQVFQSLCPHSCFLESSNLVHSLLLLNLLKFLLSSEHLSFLSLFIESLLFSFQILLLL